MLYFDVLLQYKTCFTIRIVSIGKLMIRINAIAGVLGLECARKATSVNLSSSSPWTGSTYFLRKRAALGFQNGEEENHS